MLAHNQFIGSERASLSAAGFTLGRWVADPCGDRVRPHSHADAHLMLALGGAYATDAEGEAETGRPTFIYNPAWVEHHDRFLSPGWFFSLSIAPARLAQLGAGIDLPQRPTVVGRPRAHAAARRLLAACAACKDTATLEALCLELLGAVAPPQVEETTVPGWLRRAAEALRDPSTGQVRIDELASEAGVHPVHLARAFRRFYGCTPSGYLRGQRLDQAADLLRKGEQPLAEVALDCGFADQSHFTRCFTSAYGVSPARFRRAVGGHV